MKNLLTIILLIIVSTAASFAQSDKSQTAKIDVFVREQMKSKNIPDLSLAVVRDGKIVVAKDYGMTNLELSVPANENTAFALC